MYFLYCNNTVCQGLTQSVTEILFYITFLWPSIISQDKEKYFSILIFSQLQTKARAAYGCTSIVL